MASGNDMKVQDMKAHRGTYGSFIALLKWSVPLIALLTLLIVVVISS